MTLFDIDDGSKIEFTSPMGSAQLKGCHEVQNIGAVETYQRRYLYVTALAIVEHDALDSSMPLEEPIKVSAITPQQISTINNLLQKTNTDETKFLEFFKKASVALLDRSQATNAIALLEKKVKNVN